MSAASSSVVVEQESPPRAASAARQLDALFVLNSLNVGGSETKTIRVVNGLLPRGVRAGIAYLNGPEKLLDLLDPGIPTWNLGRRNKFSVSAVRRLRSLLHQFEPRCVLSVNMHPALYTWLAIAAERQRPHSVALLNTTVLPGGERWRQTFYRPFLRRMDSIVFGCELQRDEWQPYLGIDRSRCGVIYNGVDTERFSPHSPASIAQTRRKLGIPAEAFVVGTVGRLAPEKNQAALLDAVAALRRRSIHAHLLLVGEGAKRAELERHAQRLQIQTHVTFAGVQADVRPCLAAMDVFVLPSTHIETFSNAALEAMAMARPVVLSEVGGAREMVRDGVDGYIVPPIAMSADLPLILARLFASHALREQLGHAACERARSLFSSQSMVDRFDALIARSTESRAVS